MWYHTSIPFLSRLTSVSVALALIVVSAPAHATFYDVTSDHPYVDAIDMLTREGIVRGYENRSFRPENAINRAEFTKILMGVLYPDSYIDSCVADLPQFNEGDDSEEDFTEVFPEFSFPDVGYDAWFSPSICAAWQNGIVSGFPDGFFRPEKGVKFVEAAKMLSLGFGLTGYELPNFGGSNVLWYQPYVEFLAAQNAIPFSINNLDQYINRGEMAELIYRLKDFPLVPNPAKKKSKTTDDITYPVTWKEYESPKYIFNFSYPNVWPDPRLLSRGYYDGRIPYFTSEWTVFFGPEDAHCIAANECVERDMWIDGYRLEDSDAIVNAILYDEHFVEVEDDAIINGLPTIVLLEEVGKCIDKRAFFFGGDWIYAINIRCAGQDDKLYGLFDQLIKSFKEVDEKPPEHLK
jgi:hypothetical protein